MMFKTPADKVVNIALVLVAVALMAVVAWVLPPRHHKRPQVAVIAQPLPPIESPLNQPDEATTLQLPVIRDPIEDNRPDVAEAQTSPEDAIDHYPDGGFVQPGPPIVRAPPDSAAVGGHSGGDRGVSDKPRAVFHHKARKHKRARCPKA